MYRFEEISNLDSFELRVGLRIIVLVRNKTSISPTTGFFCSIIRLPHLITLMTEMIREMKEVLSCPGRFRASPDTDSEISTLFEVLSRSPEHDANFYLRVG